MGCATLPPAIRCRATAPQIPAAVRSTPTSRRRRRCRLTRPCSLPPPAAAAAAGSAYSLADELSGISKDHPVSAFVQNLDDHTAPPQGTLAYAQKLLAIGAPTPVIHMYNKVEHSPLYARWDCRCCFHRRCWLLVLLLLLLPPPPPPPPPTDRPIGRRRVATASGCARLSKAGWRSATGQRRSNDFCRTTAWRKVGRPASPSRRRCWCRTVPSEGRRCWSQSRTVME